jgi:hypothetical protein
VPGRLAGKAAALTAAAVAVVALAGCESAMQQFRSQLNPLRQEVQTERSQIAATLQAVHLNDPTGAQLLDREIAALSKMFTLIAKLSTPNSNVKQALATYSAANRGLVKALYRVAGLVSHGTVHQIQVASVDATNEAGAVQRGSDALDATITPGG